MAESSGNDKMYIIIILVMIFCFIYWYQTRLDTTTECEKCKNHHNDKNHKSDKHHEKNKNNTLKGIIKNNVKNNTKTNTKTNTKPNVKTNTKTNHHKTSHYKNKKCQENDQEEDVNGKQKSHSKPKKTVKFKDEDENIGDDETEISLDSLDSADHANSSGRQTNPQEAFKRAKAEDDAESESCSSLEM